QAPVHPVVDNHRDASTARARAPHERDHATRPPATRTKREHSSRPNARNVRRQRRASCHSDRYVYAYSRHPPSARFITDTSPSRGPNLTTVSPNSLAPSWLAEYSDRSRRITSSCDGCPALICRATTRLPRL